MPSASFEPIQNEPEGTSAMFSVRRRRDPAATAETGPATYMRATVSTQQSDPTKNDRWFAATLNPAFPFATLFLGDYSNIAVVPGTTHVVAYWTDMRNEACFGSRCGHGEDAYFAYAS